MSEALGPARRPDHPLDWIASEEGRPTVVSNYQEVRRRTDAATTKAVVEDWLLEHVLVMSMCYAD